MKEIWQGKQKYFKKTHPSATLSTTWPDLGSNRTSDGKPPELWHDLEGKKNTTKKGLYNSVGWAEFQVKARNRKCVCRIKLLHHSPISGQGIREIHGKHAWTRCTAYHIAKCKCFLIICLLRYSNKKIYFSLLNVRRFREKYSKK